MVAVRIAQANQLSRRNIQSCDQQAPERNPLSCHAASISVRIGKEGACDVAIKLRTSRLEPGVPRQVAVDQEWLR